MVDTVTRQRIPGATLAPTWDLPAVTADGDGAFVLGAVAFPPTAPYKLGLSAPGHVTHEVWVGWERGARSDVTLDLIRETAPFSLEFYRQLVRGTYDHTDGPWPVLRLTDAPRFYLKTVDQDGKPIEPEVLDVVRDALARAVPAFTGGRMQALAIETGTSVREGASGWINVDIIRDPSQRQICGYAYIGRNPGSITLYSDVCSCGSRKVPGALVMHEVGHALGFFHVDDRNSLMFPIDSGGCPPGALSAAESYHAAIAYSRPRGNMDPDRDPSSSAHFTLPAPLAIR